MGVSAGRKFARPRDGTVSAVRHDLPQTKCELGTCQPNDSLTAQGNFCLSVTGTSKILRTIL